MAAKHSSFSSVTSSPPIVICETRLETELDHDVKCADVVGGCQVCDESPFVALFVHQPLATTMLLLNRLASSPFLSLVATKMLGRRTPFQGYFRQKTAREPERNKHNFCLPLATDQIPLLSSVNFFPAKIKQCKAKSLKSCCFQKLMVIECCCCLIYWPNVATFLGALCPSKSGLMNKHIVKR